jgi:hypothetical protein
MIGDDKQKQNKTKMSQFVAHVAGNGHDSPEVVEQSGPGFNRLRIPVLASKPRGG